MKLENLRIFISYPRSGAAHTWAEAVQVHLAREGAHVWRDETGVAEGDPDWSDRIEGELLAADLLVAIVGTDSEVCRWQKRELVTADGRGKPVVALRIDVRARMPFAICEAHPVEVRPDRAATLAALAEAIARAAPAPLPASNPTDAGANAIPPEQRRAEVAWLENLIYRELTDRAALYVPIEGIERNSPAAERALKKVRIPTESLFRAFGVDETAAHSVDPTTYSDVLDAYRALGSRAVRRLAVLGEPGAGKSFSLERIALAYADRALRESDAPIPLLVALGLWTRDGESLEDFIARSLGDLGRHLPALIAQGRAVLLLDAINEIPPGQRRRKAAQILALAQDERLASVVVSCREKDFAEFSLPFDTLTLQPLSPPKVRDFLRSYYEAQRGKEASGAADARFWLIAGGEDVRDAWEAWHAIGAEDLFWIADEIPYENPNVRSQTTWHQQEAWRRARSDPRSLLRLAANPYLLYIMAVLPALPATRAQLFQGFLDVLYDRERKARADRHDSRVPEPKRWLAALTQLAEVLQRHPPTDSSTNEPGTRTALPRSEWDATLDHDLLDFARDASVLELHGDDLRFTHQLLQEYLASRLLLDASSGTRPAADFWPHARWWERSGWEVVAEIAAESCDNEAAQIRLIAWLGKANPDIAADLWRHVGAPVLPADLVDAFASRWLPRMTDPDLEPHPRARAAIGRAMGRFGLDRRPGVGLRPDGLPDIDWVEIPGPEPFTYQDGTHPGLPTFSISRYPVTNAQFQAFIDAGGYEDEQWWKGLAKHIEKPEAPGWDEANSPREAVSWFEAMAFCRWLGDVTGEPIALTAELQWERAARGTDGREYPWGAFAPDRLNARAVHSYENLESDIARTAAVGIFPQGRSPEGVLDLAGNVWEWCLNASERPDQEGSTSRAFRVLRGGSWTDIAFFCRAASRGAHRPDDRLNNIGFRVCRGTPINALGPAMPQTETRGLWRSGTGPSGIRFVVPRLAQKVI